jgi:serine/threonine-protein kinase
MGSVYDVEDITVEKRYVLKTLHPNLVSREDLALRMRDEAKSLAKLQHPNIVDVVTAGVTNDAQKMPFYVMERLIGQNLRVVLEKTGVLHVLHAYRIAIDVADALEHAHENNIVHRDVKPENIFLHRNANGTTTTKLLDFGIVRLLDRKSSHTHGKFIGTLRYASPEQITGGKVGPATDVYSLGVVLFEMLCGRGPFDDAGDAYAIGAAHANVPAPPLSRFVRGVAPDVESIVASALAKRPEERPRDCFAFASELRRILRDEEASPASATAVNLLTSASPFTNARPGPASNAPTEQGMVAPSLVVSDRSSELSAPSTTRAEGEGEAGISVNPIAPTLAAEDPLPYSPNVHAPPTPAAGAPPIAARVVDRNAPTRASAPLGGTQRFAPNDTQMDLDGGVADDARVHLPSGRLGTPAPAVTPPGVVTRSNSGESELAFPPLHAVSGTGPLSAEARTRPPERGPVILVGVAAVLAVAMVGGAVVAVRRPWQAAGKNATASEPSPPRSISVPAVAVDVAGSAAASASGPTVNPSALLPSPPVSSAPAELPTTAPSSTHAGKAQRPSQPQTARASSEAKPRSSAPAATKDIPFDP